MTSSGGAQNLPLEFLGAALHGPSCQALLKALLKASRCSRVTSLPLLAALIAARCSSLRGFPERAALIFARNSGRLRDSLRDSSPSAVSFRPFAALLIWRRCAAVNGGKRFPVWDSASLARHSSDRWRPRFAALSLARCASVKTRPFSAALIFRREPSVCSCLLPPNVWLYPRGCVYDLVAMIHAVCRRLSRLVLSACTSSSTRNACSPYSRMAA